MAKSLVQLLAEKAGKPKASPKKQRSAPSSSSSSGNKAPDARDGTSKEKLFAIYGKHRKTIKKTLKRPAAPSRRPGKKHEDEAANAEGKKCEDVQLM